MKRTIFLVDMNAFFISCEMTRYKSLAGLPAAVAGDPKKRTGIILAANYEARKFGIKTAMTLHEALKYCPEIQLLPPDHSFYSQKSKEVMKLLSNYSPLIEQNSIDEAWLDMTGSGGVFGNPLACAEDIMKHLKQELGLWCSIGISENKFLAKMASNIKKPLGITEIWKDDIAFKLWPLPIGAMQGVGKQTAKKLKDMDIQTIGALALLPQTFLSAKLGKHGASLHQMANGIDHSPVIPHSENDMKSIGRSCTLPEDLSDIETLKIKLMHLADEVGITARKYDKKGHIVQITIKYFNFEIITRQASIPATNLTKDITCAGIELLNKNWNPYKPVRLIGITLSGFDEDEIMNQISMFDHPGVCHSSKKEEILEKTIDEIRNKYGFSKTNRAILMEDKK
ncbi:MAG: DNA polymerase IV [Eubacteriales bacterium]